MFEHNIGSPHFTTSLNQEAYLDFPDSHKSVQQRLCDLDSSSFSFQILLIRGSFDAATLHLPTLLSPSSFSTTSISPISPPVTNFSKNTDPAQIFIRYLINNVYHDSSFRCQWLGFNLHVSNVYSFYSLDCSLFSGIASFPSYIQLLRQSNHLDLNLSSYELSLLDKIEDSTTSTLSFGLIIQIPLHCFVGGAMVHTVYVDVVVIYLPFHFLPLAILTHFLFLKLLIFV